MRILSKVIIILIFVLAGFLFTHNFTSINVDIGRHIKLGEIIWQTKEVPQTNLFSYTAPDYPFINHHWLSEVVFYGIYSLGGGLVVGLKSVMTLKIIILLATYLILFWIVKRNNILSVATAFVVSVFVFSGRTEPRPEIFSYLIFAAYLFIIYRARENSTSKFLNFSISSHKLLWLLPLLQLLWVNLHIYFIIGPLIYLLFMIDEMVGKKAWKFKNLNLIENWKLKIGIFFLVVLANLVNPNFYEGAIYPLKVFQNYGYDVAENSSLFFLANHLGYWTPQAKLFLIALFAIAASFIVRFLLNRRDIKYGFFDVALTTLTVFLSFKMQRNGTLFALSAFPVLSQNLNGLFNRIKSAIFLRFLLFFTILFLIFSFFVIKSDKYYDWLDSPKLFGLDVSISVQNGIEFIKDNKISGPVFNNFDIGSYLIWQLYPQQKVFVDGRPEAYPASFFKKIYRPMQSDAAVWEQKSREYGINYIFFAHTDMTEWADSFLIRIAKDKNWPLVFLNDSVAIFLKDAGFNRPVIDKNKITEENAKEKISQVLEKLNPKDSNAFINYGNAFYRFRWLDASVEVFKALIKAQPLNAYGYQGVGYAYATMNDPKAQKEAAENLKMAINLGFKTANNYFTLGIVNANLGNFFAAEENLKKALELSPENQNIQQVLEVVKKRTRLIE